jgi:LAO/AO transport system kinase
VVSLLLEPGRLIAAAQEGDRRALARLVSIVEDQRGGVDLVLGAAYPDRGSTYRIGITGAPGSGKSTLADRFISHLRSAGEQVAVLAVDPTSPFSGGAVLGDRIRMQDHSADPGVYIRSMASRGHLGGLSAAAPRALAVLGIAGFGYVLVETVGVGQDEVEVAGAADTTVVVVNPGWGDAIQTAKAGILEIGDVFVVNKADRPGAEEAAADLMSMLAMGSGRSWDPPVLTTIAWQGTGTREVMEAVLAHRRHLEASDGLEQRRRCRRRGELDAALQQECSRRIASLTSSQAHGDIVRRVEDGQADPWSAAEQLLSTDTALRRPR